MSSRNQHTTRDFHGYYQVQELYEVPDKTGGFKSQKRWMFCIVGFGSLKELTGCCEVRILKWDGTNEIIDMDKKDRITINGKKYGRRHWNH